MRDRLRAALGPAANVARGTAIGTAEAVLGVYGGTVALIVGVYELKRDGQRPAVGRQVSVASSQSIHAPTWPTIHPAHAA